MRPTADTSPTPNPDAMVAHFEALYGKEAEGYIIVMTGHGAGVRHQGFPFSGRRLAAEFMASQTSRAPTYAALALHSQAAYNQGTRRKDTAVVVPGIALDIDLSYGVHAASNLPATAEAAMELVAAAGVPSPTEIVSSGGGLYAYWLFDVPFVIRSEADRDRVAALLNSWHNKVAEAFTAAGFKLDKVSDLARVFRVPGCLNTKTDPPKPVTRLECGSGERWQVAELESMVPQAAPQPTRPTDDDFLTQLKRDRFRAATDEDRKAAEGLQGVINGCDFVASCVNDRQRLDEPRWKDLADLMAHLPGGDHYFHLLSQGDERYDHRETEDKLKRARTYRPKRCETLADRHAGCATCPFREGGVLNSPISLARTTPELVELQGRYVLDAKTGLYFEPRAGRLKSKDDFNRSYSKQIRSGGIVNRQFENSPTSVIVDEHDYIVGDSRLIISNDGLSVLNTWREGGVAAAPGDASLWLDHLFYLVPNEDERFHLIQYLAHLLQEPGVKINSAVLIQSAPGVGKNLLAEALGRMMHPNDIRVRPGSILSNRFKADMGNTRLLVLDEMQLSDLRDAENEFKPWVTEERVPVERKGVDFFDVRTPRGSFIFSNHDKPISIPDGDRRIFVLKVEAERRDPSYYIRLAVEGMSDAAIGAFKDYLLNVNLTGFMPKAAPPMTQAKRDLIQMSRPVLEQQIEWLIENGQWPFDRPVYMVDRVIQALRVTYRNSVTAQSVTAILKRMGHQKVGPRLTLNKFERGRLWASQDIERWQSASREDLLLALEGRPEAQGSPHLSLVFQGGQLTN